MAKISFRARTTIKALGHSTAKRTIETLASHGVSSEAHPNLARKGDGFGDTTRPLSIMQAHRNNKFAHAGHYVRSSEVLDSIDEYIRARDMNYATLANALAENPQQHIVTAWILNHVIGNIYVDLEKKIDKVYDAVPGNFALWGLKGTLVDGNCKPSDFALVGHGHGQIANNGDVTMRAADEIQDVDPVNVKFLKDYYSDHFPHAHGQISWQGNVTMRPESQIKDYDPVNVEYLRYQIRNAGGVTWEDWTLDLSEQEAGKVILVDDGRTNMHEGAYSVILQAVFMIDEKEFTVDIHEPVAEVRGAIPEDLPIYVPGKSLLLISDKELKFRVPDSWIEHYGTFTQEGHKFSMDPNCEEVGVIPISSYRVIVRRMSIKFDS